MLFNLIFGNNTIFSCFFFCLSIIDLYYSTPIVIAKNFNPTAEFAIMTGMPTIEAKEEIKTH